MDIYVATYASADLECAAFKTKKSALEFLKKYGGEPTLCEKISPNSYYYEFGPDHSSEGHIDKMSYYNKW